MERNRAPLLWGSILVAAGTLWLLWSLGILHPFRMGLALVAGGVLAGIGALFLAIHQGAPANRPGMLIWASIFFALAALAAGESLGDVPDALAPLLIFGAPALACLAIARRTPARRWPPVVGWGLAVMAVAGALGEMGRLGHQLAGTVFLWGIAAAFAVHFLRTGRDWAILPAGILFSLGIAAFLEERHVTERVQTFVFLLGLAATFLTLYVLGAPGKVRWAAPAAAATGVLAVLVLLSRPVLTYAVPVALIAAGGWMILRSLRGAPLPQDGAPPAAP